MIADDTNDGVLAVVALGKAESRVTITPDVYAALEPPIVSAIVHGKQSRDRWWGRWMIVLENALDGDLEGLTGNEPEEFCPAIEKTVVLRRRIGDLETAVLDAAGAERIALAELGENEDTLRSIQAENDLLRAQAKERERNAEIKLEEVELHVEAVAVERDNLEAEVRGVKVELADARRELLTQEFGSGETGA